MHATRDSFHYDALRPQLISKKIPLSRSSWNGTLSFSPGVTLPSVSLRHLNSFCISLDLGWDIATTVYSLCISLCWLSTKT